MGSFNYVIKDEVGTVSYTHLDVYKRQALRRPAAPKG